MLSLSFKIFWRELKSGQLSIMVMALILAVTSVSCISLFTDRLQKALLLETQEFLGGDLKFDSNQELSSKSLVEMNVHNLKISKITSFASMVSSDDLLQLSSVKAVDLSYPLVGIIELQSESSQEKVKLKSPPSKGTVWLDRRLMDLLKIEIGDTVRIISGSFAGVKARVVGVAKDDKQIMAIIELLGSTAEINLNFDQVEKEV